MSKFVAPELKEKLAKALEIAVAEIQKGVPDYETAVVKAASDMGLNMDQTARLCEHFNRARAIYQYGKTDKRADEYEVVQPSRVLERMVTVSKTASEHHLPDYRAYDRKPTNFRTAEKVAADPAPRTGPRLGDTVELAARRALNMCSQREKKAQDAADVGNMLLTRSQMLMDKVATSLAAMSVDDAGRSLAKLCRLYGGAKSASFGPVSDLARLLPKAHARSVTGEKVASVSLPVRLSAQEQDWAATLDAVVQDKEAAQRYLVFAASEKTAAVRDRKQALGFFQAPKPEKGAFDDFFGSGQKQEKGAFEDFFGSGQKQANAGAAAGTPTKTPTKPQPASRAQMAGKMLQQLPETKKPYQHTTPEFRSLALDATLPDVASVQRARDADLEDIDMQATIQELLIRDPILSQADEQEVMNAFAALQELSPQLVRNKEITRSMLRQMLHSDGLSVYDADTIAKLNKQQLETAKLQKEMSTPGSTPVADAVQDRVAQGGALRFAVGSPPAKEDDDKKKDKK